MCHIFIPKSTKLFTLTTKQGGGGVIKSNHNIKRNSSLWNMISKNQQNKLRQTKNNEKKDNFSIHVKDRI